MDWYVIQVITGKEQEFQAMARHLIIETGGSQLHLPTRRLTERRRGKSCVADKPVFPGYVFLSTPALTAEQAGEYRRITGFMRWLGSQGTPEPLRNQDLQILQRLLVHGDILGISRVSFGADMRIQVLSGPLKGLEGLIVKVDKRKQRARVRLDMYHNSFEVDFGFELIKPSQEETA